MDIRWYTRLLEKFDKEIELKLELGLHRMLSGLCDSDSSGPSGQKMNAHFLCIARLRSFGFLVLSCCHELYHPGTGYINIRMTMEYNWHNYGGTGVASQCPFDRCLDFPTIRFSERSDSQAAGRQEAGGEGLLPQRRK